MSGHHSVRAIIPAFSRFAFGTNRSHDATDDGRNRVPDPAEKFAFQAGQPSARADDTLFHRDVGALQLLRDARAAGAVHDGVGFRRRHGHGSRQRRRDLRLVHLHGVPALASRRVGGGQTVGAAQGGVRRRLHHRLRAFFDGHSRGADFLSGVDADRDRHGPAEAERQRDGRRTCIPKAARGAMRAFRFSTWASISARSSDLRCAG